MNILAIETSCDETAAAVVERMTSTLPTQSNVRVRASVVASQANLHARTAGVVPEVAARAHVEAITAVIDEAVRQGVGSRESGVGTIDAVAATTEPGLRPALVIGETAARALAVAWEKPFIPVNHLAGHIAAAWLVSEGTGNREPDFAEAMPGRQATGTQLPGQPAVEHRFPTIALVVSGGHTQLWKITLRKSAIINDSTFAPATSKAGNGGALVCQLLGQTRDDAAGEAFDKIARLLGLPYPGGAALAKLAEGGDACEVELPRPMIDSGDLDFSFSGLKTAVYYLLRGNRKQATGDRELSEQLRRNVAASAQEAIVDVLAAKTVDAAAREGAAEVILTGGVAANTRLRTRLKDALGSLPLIVPHPQYCTDNAAMIGAAALLGIQIP